MDVGRQSRVSRNIKNVKQSNQLLRLWWVGKDEEESRWSGGRKVLIYTVGWQWKVKDGCGENLRCGRSLRRRLLTERGRTAQNQYPARHLETEHGNNDVWQTASKISFRSKGTTREPLHVTVAVLSSFARSQRARSDDARTGTTVNNLEEVGKHGS